jgi:hypothetical protein
MSALLGAILHPHPQQAIVIGLGTGSTAGWLGKIPSLKKVDVVELEPSILEVARACKPVNQDVLHNPKVQILFGDAREVLLTTPERYDLIFSEPSNPFRSGIASLFTQEYYRAIDARLHSEGIFIQWVQAYEIDSQTIKTIYTTLGSVFPEIQTWYTNVGDLLLVAGKRPITVNAQTISQRITATPYREALLYTWRVTNLEDFLSHFLVGSDLPRSIAKKEGDWLNSDNQNHVEFGFARMVGHNNYIITPSLLTLAQQQKESRKFVQGQVDWSRVREYRAKNFLKTQIIPLDQALYPLTPKGQQRTLALHYFWSGKIKEALAVWRSLKEEPGTPDELCLVAMGLADAGSEEAMPYIEKLQRLSPVEANIARAMLSYAKKKREETAERLTQAFLQMRSDPWPLTQAIEIGRNLTLQLTRQDTKLAKKFFQVFERPFAVYVFNELRLEALFQMARIDDNINCLRLLKHFEPHGPWNETYLSYRKTCYQMKQHPLFAKAHAEWLEFQEKKPQPL